MRVCRETSTNKELAGEELITGGISHDTIHLDIGNHTRIVGNRHTLHLGRDGEAQHCLRLG